MASGRFITFEGGEGAGKSTQARLLADRLRAGGRDAIVTREPGGTPLGEAIRALILSTKPAPYAEFLLFAAARAEHVETVIRPALERGAWVISDRFTDSTRVYQQRLAGIDGALVQAVEAATTRGATPDMTVLLDLDPEVGLARALRRGDANRYDKAGIDYHRSLRDGFLRIARAEPERCLVVDGGQSTEAVAAAVWAAVESRLLVGAG